MARKAGPPRGRRIPVPPLSRDAKQVLKQVPPDGSTVSNIRLRSLVAALGDQSFREARQELIEKKVVRIGRGRGGTLALATPQSRSLANALVPAERSLYEPVRKWRESVFPDDLAFSFCRVTSSPRARKRASGQWSRPDVTAVQVARYPNLPQVTVEVFSYEVKRWPDASRLESVYEASAHGRWAHRSSLVIEVPSGAEIPENVQEEVGRLHLGLYQMTHRNASQIITEVITPALLSPEPEALNALLDHLFKGKPKEGDDFRLAIGR